MKADNCLCPECGNEDIEVINYPSCFTTKTLWLLCRRCGFNVILVKDDPNPFISGHPAFLLDSFQMDSMV